MSLLIETLFCKQVARRPVWLMRQAGRYLPEYQDFRKKHSLFSCFHEPDLAVEATLMPLKRFDLDAAIVFSDLLVIAEVWGKKVLYPEKDGPCIFPVLKSIEELYVPTKEEVKEKLSYVFSTITLLTPKLSLPLIGFCGAPFTLLCYLLEGKGGTSFPTVRTWIEHRNQEFLALLEMVAETCILFAKLQIEAGVEAFQIFDSWANLLSQEEFSLYVLPYWKKMQDALEPLRIPLLFFSRSNSAYPTLISSIKPRCISFDEGVSLATLRKIVPKEIAIQGNFSPHLLAFGSISEIKKAAFAMVDSVREEAGIVFNLGHGVLPKTPIENVMAFLDSLRFYER